MKPIPTAEEWIKSLYNINSSSEIALGGKLLTDKLIEFAKIHVEAQVKEIVEKFKMKDLNENNELNVNEDDSNFEWYVVDKNSILEAYPLTNIK